MLIAALLLAASPVAAADIPLDLGGLPRLPAMLVAHGKTLACEGVRINDLLARAGVPAGEALRGPALATVVIATGKDGYRVVFSLAELDAKLGNHGRLIEGRESTRREAMKAETALIAFDTQLERLRFARDETNCNGQSHLLITCINNNPKLFCL